MAAGVAGKIELERCECAEIGSERTWGVLLMSDWKYTKGCALGLTSLKG